MFLTSPYIHSKPSSICLLHFKTTAHRPPTAWVDSRSPDFVTSARSGTSVRVVCGNWEQLESKTPCLRHFLVRPKTQKTRRISG